MSEVGIFTIGCLPKEVGMKVKLDPMKVDALNWYYEEARGISFVHEVYRDGEFLQTDTIFIPWKRLLESVRRKYGNSPKEVT